MGREKVLGSGPDELAQWGEYCDRLPAKNPYALPEYIKLLEWHYGDEARLFVYEQDGAFVYFPYFRKPLEGLVAEHGGAREPCHIHSSWYYGGPLASVRAPQAGLRADFFQAWTAHARSIGAVTEFTRFDANLRNQDLMPESESEFERCTVFVDLRKEQEQIWREFNQSNRWAVNRARRDGVRVEFGAPGDESAWRRFSEVYHSEMVRKDAPAHLYLDWSFFERLRTSLPRNVVLALSRIGNEVCGGLILMFDEVHCSVFLSATDPKFWKSQVNNIGWTESIWWAKRKGLGIFDLMGGRPGVFRYKSHFSPDRARFHVRKAVYDRALYERLVAARPVPAAGEDGVGRFPAYL